MNKIYVVFGYDFENSHPYKAYHTEEKAKYVAKHLTKIRNKLNAKWKTMRKEVYGNQFLYLADDDEFNAWTKARDNLRIRHPDPRFDLDMTSGYSVWDIVIEGGEDNKVV